jgi:hypothetical protein
MDVDLVMAHFHCRLDHFGRQTVGILLSMAAFVPQVFSQIVEDPDRT